MISSNYAQDLAAAAYDLSIFLLIVNYSAFVIRKYYADSLRDLRSYNERREAPCYVIL